MNNNLKISIILPVFNSEKTLEGAIKSVIDQTYPYWELIIIDDFSIDNSLEIAKKYKKQDNRIKIITNSSNLGPAISRNKGIDNSNGHFIGFIDSDDTYENTFIEKMIENALKYEAEIVWCNYFFRFNDQEGGWQISSDIPSKKIFSGKEAMELFFNENKGICSLCNKIYLKSFIEGQKLRLNTKRMRGEDWEFNLIAFSKISKLISISDPLYNYFHRNENSIMSTFRINDFYMICRSIGLLKKINLQFNLKKSNYEIINTNRNYLLELVFLGFNSKEYCKVLKIVRQKRFQNFLKLLEAKKLPKTYRILRILLLKNFYLTTLFYSRIISFLKNNFLFLCF